MTNVTPIATRWTVLEFTPRLRTGALLTAAQLAGATIR